MFGFLRGPACDADYRRVYARCCRHLRLAFGRRAAPALSYEAVFAYQLAHEALGQSLPDSEPTCCRLRGASRLAGADDEGLGRVTAAFGLVLASIKIDDDLRDDRSLVARLASWLLGRPIRRARETFAEIDSAAPAQFDAIVAQHVALEAQPRGRTVEEFAEPTAEGFAYAFSLIARSDPRLADFEEPMTLVGRGVGQAIIAADCAWDWRADQRRNLPNPVKSPAEARAALRLAQRAIATAGWAWQSVVGDRRSIALRTLRTAIGRLDPANAATIEAPPTAAQAMQRLAVPRMPRAGFCDCDCGGCDGCGGDVGGADACSSDGGCGDGGSRHGPCCCDGCDVCCCDDCCCDNNQRDKKTKSVSEKAIRGSGSFVGRKGHANGNLKPEGLVAINGRSHPAKTRGETLRGGTGVVVVEDGEFGLIVEAVENPDE